MLAVSMFPSTPAFSGSVTNNMNGKEVFKKGVLFVSSRPTDATVLIDSIPEGSTPVRLLLSPGKHVAVLSKTGRVLSVDTLEIVAGTSISVDDSLFPLPVASIASTPEGARVFVDSVFVGRTPLDSVLIPVGYHQISLSMSGYKERIVRFLVEPGIRQRMVTNLIPNYGFISVEVSPPDSRLTIDNGYPVTGNLNPERVSLGWHTLVASHPGYDDTKVMRFFVSPGSYEQFRAGLDFFSPRAATCSAFVPGLGQILDGSYVKGSAELAANTAAMFFLLNSLAHRSTRENDYTLAEASYQAATTEEQAILTHGNLWVAASNLTRARNMVVAGFIAAGVAYVATIADALIFNSTNRRITITSNTQLDSRQIIKLNRQGDVRVGMDLHF